MDLQQLQYFKALAETLNYTAAARRCFISRQGMRQAIQALEEEYGVTLVENQHNHLSLTPAGELLASGAASVLSAMHELNTAMHQQVVCDSPLRIGISRSLLPFYAPELTARAEAFTREFPGIKTRFSTMSSDEILRQLRSKDLDCGLLVDMSGAAHGFPRTPLRSDEMIIFLRSTHPLAESDQLRTTDLDGQTLLTMGDPEQLFTPLCEAFRCAGIQVDYQIVPDYYEVGYRILNSDCIAMDRYDAAALPRRGPLDTHLSFEEHHFTLNVSLIAVETVPGGFPFFRQFLLSRQP